MKILSLCVKAASCLAWLQCIAVLFTALRRPTKIRPGNFAPALVIIPAYNEESRLAATIEAWGASLRAGSKIVVVDDGSTDDTARIAGSVSCPGVSVSVVPAKGRGKSAALNQMIYEMEAAIVVFCDADTRPDTGAMDHLLGEFSDPAIVGVSAHRRLSGSGLLTKILNIEHSLGANLTRHVGNTVGFQIGVSGAACAFRREALLAVGGFPLDQVSEDTALTLLIQRVGKVVYQPRALVWTATETVSRSLQQHTRWLVGSIMAVIGQGAPSQTSLRKRLMLGYFICFRLILPTVAPLVDYQFAWELTHDNRRRALGRYSMFVLPNLITGLTALSLEGRGRDSKFLPVAQLVIRQYASILLVSAIFRGRSIVSGWLRREHLTNDGESGPD